MLLVIAGEGPGAARTWSAWRGAWGWPSTTCFRRLPGSATGHCSDCYRAGDVFVFASRTETQGLVLLEAMALGVPVVSTAVMGTAEVLEPRGAAV